MLKILSGGSQQEGADLNCEVQDLLLEVVDLKQEVSDLRSGVIPPIYPLQVTSKNVIVSCTFLVF